MFTVITELRRKLIDQLAVESGAVIQVSRHDALLLVRVLEDMAENQRIVDAMHSFLLARRLAKGRLEE